MEARASFVRAFYLSERNYCTLYAKRSAFFEVGGAERLKIKVFSQ